MMRVSAVEEIMPPMMVHPKGAHKLLPVSVSGSKPTMVVRVVSTMNIKRVSLASGMAWMRASPW